MSKAEAGHTVWNSLELAIAVGAAARSIRRLAALREEPRGGFSEKEDAAASLDRSRRDRAQESVARQCLRAQLFGAAQQPPALVVVKN